MRVPLISVGILSGKEIEFSFPIKFISSDGTESSGMQKAIYRDGKIHWQGKEYNELSFTPQQGAPAFFELKDVTIGINFHWERKEVQKFKGELKIIVEGEQLTAINIISIEEYLISVISSEMSATASLELLKAHAVISRSWLLNKCKTESRKQEMKNEKTGKSYRRIAQPVLHLSFRILNLSNGMTTKCTKTLTYAQTITANGIKESHVPQHHKLSKQSLLPGAKY